MTVETIVFNLQSISTGYFNTVILFPSCHDVHFCLTLARDPALHAQSQSFRLVCTCSFICLSNEGNCALWENICSDEMYSQRYISQTTIIYVGYANRKLSRIALLNNCNNTNYNNPRKCSIAVFFLLKMRTSNCSFIELRFRDEKIIRCTSVKSTESKMR